MIECCCGGSVVRAICDTLAELEEPSRKIHVKQPTRAVLDINIFGLASFRSLLFERKPHATCFRGKLLFGELSGLFKDRLPQVDGNPFAECGFTAYGSQ